MIELKKKLTASLTEELNRQVAFVLEKAGNAPEVKDALDEIVSLKGQLSVIPTEIDIPAEDVVKRYPITQAMEIVRCKTAIFFHSTCFWVVSKPSMANDMQGTALYQMLSWYCDYRDNRSEFDEDERTAYDALCSTVETILSLPMDVFTDNDFLVGVAGDIIDRRIAYYEGLRAKAAELMEVSEEDEAKNNEFERIVRESEKLTLDADGKPLS